MSHSSHPFTPYVSHPKKMISSNLKFWLNKSQMPRKKKPFRTHQAQVLGASGPSKVIKPPGENCPFSLGDMSPLWWVRNILATHGIANIYAKFEVPVSTKRTKKNPTHKSPHRRWHQQFPELNGWRSCRIAFELQARPLKGMVALPPA